MRKCQLSNTGTKSIHSGQLTHIHVIVIIIVLYSSEIPTDRYATRCYNNHEHVKGIGRKHAQIREEQNAALANTQHVNLNCTKGLLFQSLRCHRKWQDDRLCSLLLVIYSSVRNCEDVTNVLHPSSLQTAEFHVTKYSFGHVVSSIRGSNGKEHIMGDVRLP